MGMRERVQALHGEFELLAEPGAGLSVRARIPLARGRATPQPAAAQLMANGAWASGPIRVMLVDDHAVVRMGFRLLLQGTPDIEVAAEADSGEEAVRQFPEVQPDVVVMDISMPGIGGLEAIGRILARAAGRARSWCCRPMRTRCTRGACSRPARSATSPSAARPRR